MRRGRRAADDGSFGRSAGVAAGRGVLLLALAVLLGVVLLNAVDAAPPGDATRVAAGGDDEGDGGEAGGEDGGEGKGGGDGGEAADTTTTVPPARPAAEVKVLVANASGVNKAAGAVTDRLRPSGYNLLAPTNATVKVDDPAVLYAEGFEQEAKALAAELGLAADVAAPLPAQAPVADLKGANLLVLVDDDLAKAAAAATTATTAAGGTATTTTTAAG